ncbi:MAG: general secretion pathway protein GspK [Deltaproteobacteria bacterium]|nr:general secretion pathway protein GspK [Deltaproteobacteria bacterium]
MTARPSPIRTERGVALLSALFAVALLTVVVVEMTDATLVHTHLTRNAGNAMAAQLLARSAALAGEALLSSDDANPPGVTCRQNPWALPLFGIPAGSGVVGLQVSDETGKLDLNSVHEERYRTAVQSLFASLELDPSLVDRVAAWIKPPGEAMATGAASIYCALDMSCTPREEPLHSLEELLLIRGFDEPALARLRPYATVVPRADGKAGPAQSVNPLTADPIVLAAIGCESGSPPPDGCPSPFASDEAKNEWDAKFLEWKSSSCTPEAQRMLKTQSNLYSVFATGTVGDVTQRLRETVRRTGDTTQRLWWQESRLAEGMPVEIR